MNRTELIAAVADATGLAPRQAAEAVGATLDGIARGMAEEGSVTISGFGTFEARERAARTGRNPRTGEAMEIAATVAPAFKAAAGLKRQVANGRKG